MTENINITAQSQAKKWITVVTNFLELPILLSPLTVVIAGAIPISKVVLI